MTGESPEPRLDFDGRVMLWFFSWLGGLFLCSGGFVIAVFLSPTIMKFVGDSPLIIPLMVLLGAICVVCALTPWYLGIRCRQCQTRLHRIRSECDINTGNTPLRFHCKTCEVIWDTKLVSGPGEPRTSIDT